MVIESKLFLNAAFPETLQTVTCNAHLYNAYVLTNVYKKNLNVFI